MRHLVQRTIDANHKDDILQTAMSDTSMASVSNILAAQTILEVMVLLILLSHGFS